LESYCVVGSMTMELPLSARVIMALLFFSLVWIDLISLDSVCEEGFGLLVLFCRRNFSKWSAASFL
jgi:hypothetical protein